MHLDLHLGNTWETILFLLVLRKPGTTNSKWTMQERSRMLDRLLISNSSLAHKQATRLVRINNSNLKFKFREWPLKESQWKWRTGFFIIWPFIIAIPYLAAAVTDTELLELDSPTIAHSRCKLHWVGGLRSHIKRRRLPQATWTINNCYL